MLRARVFTAQEVMNKAVRQGGVVVKFVRVGDDEYRFQYPESLIHHNDMLADGEQPASAGFFTMFQDGDTENWKISLQDVPSTSLKMLPLPEDQQKLEHIFRLLGETSGGA